MNEYHHQRQQQYTTLFRNHSAAKRQIRLNSDLTVCDVFSARRATKEGDPDYQTTFQDPTVGKYIIVFNNVPSAVIRVYDLDRPYSERRVFGDELNSILNRLPKIIIEWLKDVATKRHQNFIPAGYGWDGNFTASENKKRQTAHLLFIPSYARSSNIDNDWLKEVLDEICRTPKGLLTLKWKDASPFPHDRYLKRTNVIHDKDYVFIDSDGNIQIQPRKRIIGDVSAYKGLYIPKNVVKVIELTHGITCRDDGSSAGVQVELYHEL